MSVPTLHETEVEELDLPGRHLRWVVSPQGIPAEHCSACVIRVAPGERVRPAHSHPHGEEVIYIIRGTGRVLVAGEVSSVREGTTVLFPQRGGSHASQHGHGRDEGRVLLRSCAAIRM